MANFNKIVFNSVIYTASGLLIKCVSLFLLPLYTVYLTTEDYGINNIAGSFTRTMSFIVAMSLFSAVLRFFVDLKDDEEKLKRFYGTIVTFIFISGLFWAILIYLLKDTVSKYIFAGVNFFPVIFICVLSLSFECQHNIYTNILKSQQKALKISIINIVYFLVTVSLNILFVVVYKKGAVGTLTATLIANVLYTIFFISDMLMSKQIVFCLDINTLKSALKYSIPIMPHNLATQISMLVSKSLIGGNNSLSSLGIYSVSSQFGNMADMIQVYVDQAYGPWLYENLKEKKDDYKQSIRKMSKMLSAVIGLFFIGIALFAQDYIILFADKSYVESWKYIPLIVSVFSIKTTYYFYVEILFYYKKASKKLFLATVSSNIANVLIAYLLIPVIGIYGSILADAISTLSTVMIIIIISKRYEDIGLHIKDFVNNFIIVNFFIYVGLLLSYVKFGNTFSIINFLYKVVVVLIYILTLILRYKNEFLLLLKNIKGKKR